MTIRSLPNCWVWTGKALVYPLARLWLQALPPLGLPNPVRRLRALELSLPNVFPLPSHRENPTAELSLSIPLLPSRLWTRSLLDNNKKSSSARKTFNQAWREGWEHFCQNWTAWIVSRRQNDYIKNAESCLSWLERISFRSTLLCSSPLLRQRAARVRMDEGVSWRKFAVCRCGGLSRFHLEGSCF